MTAQSTDKTAKSKCHALNSRSPAMCVSFAVHDVGNSVVFGSQLQKTKNCHVCLIIYSDVYKNLSLSGTIHRHTYMHTYVCTWERKNLEQYHLLFMNASYLSLLLDDILRLFTFIRIQLLLADDPANTNGISPEFSAI